MAGVLSPVAVTNSEVARHDPSRFYESEIDSQTYFVDIWPEITSLDINVDFNNEPSPDVGRGVLWHPLQLWALDQVEQRLNLNIAEEAVLSGKDAYINMVDKLWNSRAPEELLTAFASDGLHRQLPAVVAIWVSAEAIAITAVDDHIRLNDFPHRQGLTNYYEWREGRNWSTLLDDVGLTSDQLVKWHEMLSVRAALRDPMARWRTLIRYAPRTERIRTAGTALFAEDYYYFAEVIRRYLQKYHGLENLPEEDDALHKEQGAVVKERLYGSRVTTDFNRGVFRKVVRQYQLDPQPRLRWFMEGDSEIGFMERFAELSGVDLEQSGIETINLNGLGGLAGDKTRILLQVSQIEEVFTYVSIDHDGLDKYSSMLRTFSDQKLLPAGFHVYKPDFESENFTMEELAIAATRHASFDTATDVKFTEEEISQEQASTGLPVGKLIERLGRKKRTQVAKGQTWGKILAEIAAADKHQGLESHRSVVREFAKSLRANNSSYAGTIDRFRVSEIGDLIEIPR